MIDLSSTTARLAALVLVAVLVTACGRKGDPEPPPSRTITTEEGKRVEKPQEDKRFVLDGLLE